MPARGAKTDALIVLGNRSTKVERFAASELARVLREQSGLEAETLSLKAASTQRLSRYPLFILGSEGSNDLVASLAKKKAFTPERHEQGFSVKTVKNPYNPKKDAMVLAGADERGTLYAVRDLTHYHLPKGRARARLPKVSFESYPSTIRRGSFSWEYYIKDWRSYIDRLSDWKQTALMVCGHMYLLEQPEIFGYAAERGIDIYLGMGIFSWEFTQIKVHRAQAWLPEAPPKWVKLSPNGYVICPSDERSFKWQIDRIVEIVRAMPQLKGFLFQTGVLDFPDCDCDKCSRLPADERFLMMANPVIDAVLTERPDIYMVHSIGVGQLLDDEFRLSLKRVDRRSQLMIETGILSKPEYVDLAYESTFEGGKIINHPKLYGQAGIDGYIMYEWRDMRRKIMHDVYNGIARCVTKYGTDSSFALNQYRKFGPRDFFLPAFFAETSWHAGRTDEAGFMKMMDRVKQITDLDQRISDPVQTHLKEGNSVYYIKRPEGTLVDGGWVWGQVRIVTPMVADTCDLLSESESASYAFHLPAGFRKGLKGAQLIMRGAKTDLAVVAAAQTGEVFVDDESQKAEPGGSAIGASAGKGPDYIFNVEVNGKKLGKLVCPWKPGRKVIRRGTFFAKSPEESLEAKMPNSFEGKTNWSIDIPKALLKPSTRITLHFVDPDGLVMYDKMSLKLDY